MDWSRWLFWLLRPRGWWRPRAGGRQRAANRLSLASPRNFRWWRCSRAEGAPPPEKKKIKKEKKSAADPSSASQLQIQYPEIQFTESDGF